MVVLRGCFVFVLSIVWWGCGLVPQELDQNSQAQSFDGKLRQAPESYEAIANEYIVVFNQNSALYTKLAGSSNDSGLNPYGFQILDSFPSLLAVLVKDFSEGQSTLRAMATNESVAYVQQNYKFDPWPVPEAVTALSTVRSPAFFDNLQQPAIWNLSRIDQTQGFDEDDNDAFTWPEGIFGYGIRAYIIDSGINPHPEFACPGLNPNEVCTAPGDDRIDEQNAYPGPGQVDNVGHGTHVAGTLGGVTYGVAKGVTLVPINVDVGGRPTVASMLAGMEHILEIHNPGDRAVANMSISGPKTEPIDDAIRNLIKAGISVVVAAGNHSAPVSCNISPANVPGALTVAASDINDSTAWFSNQGSCVDLFAPGVNILSADEDGGVAVSSGTSMASPHVAGSVALLLEGVDRIPGAEIDPEGVAAIVNCTATPNEVTNVDPVTPNRLLYMRHFGTSQTYQGTNLAAPPPTLSFSNPSQNDVVPNPVHVSIDFDTCALGYTELVELDGPNGTVKRILSPTPGSNNEWVTMFEAGPVYLRATVCDYFGETFSNTERCTMEELSFTATEAPSTIYLPVISR